MVVSGSDRVWDLRRWLHDGRTPKGADLLFLADGATAAPPPRSVRTFDLPSQSWVPTVAPSSPDLVPAVVFALPNAACVAACGVITSDDKWLGGAAWHAAVDVEAHAAFRWKFFANPVAADLPEGIWLGQAGDIVFGHCLLDLLPRAQLLDEQVPSQVPFIVGKKASPALEGLLALAGIGRPVVRIPMRAPVLVRTLYVGSQARQNVSFDLTRRTVFDSMAANVGAATGAAGTPYRRVHLSRRQVQDQRMAPTRSLRNRDEADQVMIDHGFSVVAPETLDLASQVRLLEQTQIVSGEVGSAMHLSLFARPGTTKLVLRNRGNPNPLDAMCAGIADLNARFFEGHPVEGTRSKRGRPQAPWTDAWRLDPGALDVATAQLIEAIDDSER